MVAHRFVFPPDSGRASFVRAAISAWARSRPEWADPDPSRLVDLLGPVDVPYRERRLLFLLAGVNGFYGREDGEAPPTEDLDRLKAEAWRLLQELYDAPQRVVEEVPQETVRFLSSDAVDPELLVSPERFAAQHADDFARLFEAYRDALSGLPETGSTPLWRVFERETQTWRQEHRLELLGRYLGFPLWDGIIFPTISLSQLPQFTPIGISQFSPLTASALPTPEGGKLKGVTLRHFGAFVRPDWRENDYLWGRLDGAELILRTLYSSRSASEKEPDAALAHQPARAALRAAGGRHLVDALRAVLADERDLRSIEDLRSTLAGQVEDLAGAVD
jgi:hypothetical protein